jgi:hypothetical protein
MKRDPKEYSLKSLTLLDIATLGLWNDDPYGDGIRLESIREPSPARVAALKLVHEGQSDLFGEKLIRDEYEVPVRRLFNGKGKLYGYVARNI